MAALEEAAKLLTRDDDDSVGTPRHSGHRGGGTASHHPRNGLNPNWKAADGRIVEKGVPSNGGSGTNCTMTVAQKASLCAKAVRVAHEMSLAASTVRFS